MSDHGFIYFVEVIGMLLYQLLSEFIGLLRIL
jgi:hypothetical protein